MPLTPPKLDDRTFKDLFEQARARIPNYLPEWTDYNDSDPGITLLQLQAWLTETLLYQLNRLPDLNYTKFLQLLGIEQLPSLAATADVTFVLDEKKLKGRSQIEIPRGTQLRVVSRDLPEPVYFETDQTLTALNAKLDKLISVTFLEGAQDVTLQNDQDNTAFKPFGDDAAYQKPALYLGFSSAEPMTGQEFGLQIYLKDEPLAPLALPSGDDCGPETTDPESPVVTWQWFDGAQWRFLTVTDDQTQALRRSGKVFVKIPGKIPSVPAHAVDLTPIPLPVALSSVQHVTANVLTEFANAPVIQTVAQLASQKEQALFDRLKTILSGADDDEKMRKVKEMLADAKRLIVNTSPPFYYWLRVVFEQGRYDRSPEIERILINTISVLAARTALDEVVGSSDGLPNQVFKLRQAPVLDELRKPGEPRRSTLVLEVDEDDGDEATKIWVEVPDFAGSGPASKNYVLNRTTGEIRFGDNRHGHIPRAGQANIIARSYRYGGGGSGNVGSRTITEMVRRIDGVKEIYNLLQATGGKDEETLPETMLRVPRQLQSNDRAVTLQDFGDLARQTPGAQIVRAYAFDAVDQPSMMTGQPVACASSIRVVVVPNRLDPRPSPSETAIRMVCQYLDERRLITTQVKVQGPLYHDVSASVAVKISPQADKTEVYTAIDAFLKRYLHPLVGGLEHTGWPFGRAIYYSELVKEIMLIPGVLRIDTIELGKKVKPIIRSVVRNNTFSLAIRLPANEQIDLWIGRSDPQGLTTILVATLASGAGGTINSTFNIPPSLHDVSQLALRMKSRTSNFNVYAWFDNISGDDADAGHYGTEEIYECCDLPVDPGALIALVDTQITTDYDRGQVVKP